MPPEESRFRPMRVVRERGVFAKHPESLKTR